MTLAVGPPTANAVTDSTNEDTPTTITLSGSDFEAVELTFTIVSGPSHGTLSLVTNQSGASGSPNTDTATVVYTPAADYHGPDSFRYRVNDGTLDSTPATVSLTVNAVNDAPAAADDYYPLRLEHQLVTVAGWGVLENDTDADGDTLTVQVVEAPDHGTLVLHADGTFAYTPNMGFTGEDTFTYTVSDGTATSGPATVTLRGYAPVAVDDGPFDTHSDTPLVLTVLDNDYDVDSTTIELLSVEDGQLGTVVGNWNDGTVTYVPNAGASGEDTFTYTIQDSQGNTAQATVTVHILFVSAAIVTNADAYTLTEDGSLQVSAASGVLANDSTGAGVTLQAVLEEGVALGTLTLNGDGSFAYTPPPDWNGALTFRYRAFDGTNSSAAVTVTLTVTGVNDAPVAEDDGVDEEITTYAGTPVAIDVLANDSDAESTPTVTAFGNGQSGTVTQDAATGRLVYTPNAGFTGTDSFSYTIGDGDGGTDTATVHVRVLPVSASIQAVADAYTLDEDMLLDVAAAGVLVNDSGSGLLQAILVTPPTKGDLAIEADGSFSYQPHRNVNGTDTFEYRAYDITTQTYSLPVTVTLHITPRPDAPVIDPHSPDVDDFGRVEIELYVGETRTLTPEEVAFDPDSEPIEFVVGSLVGGSPGLSMTSLALTVVGTTAGDFVGYAHIRDRNQGRALVELYIRILEAAAPKMDISGHFDLPVSNYSLAADQAPASGLSKLVKPKRAVIDLNGNAAAVARYVDTANPVDVFTDQTVFLLNYEPGKVPANTTVVVQGVVFDIDDRMNGNEVLFRLDGWAVVGGAAGAPYVTQTQRKDGSYDVVLRVGKYCDDQNIPIQQYTRIAFLNQAVGLGTVAVTYRNLIQATENTIPEYVPHTTQDTYSIFRQGEKVVADLRREGVGSNDYLVKFGVAKGARDSYRRYELWEPKMPAVTIRLITPPQYGTLRQAVGNQVINQGDVLPQGTFVYENRDALGRGGDQFEYEVSVAAPGGKQLRVRETALIHMGMASRTKQQVLAAIAGTVLNNQYLAPPLLSRLPISAPFKAIQAMGGGGGDFQLIMDAFKRNGATNLVVIGASFPPPKQDGYLSDVDQSAYQPFDRVDAFFFSTQEQAEDPAIQVALNRPNTAVYFAGGVQADYLDIHWGTFGPKSFLNTINAGYALKLLSFGGASAGLAIQGGRAFKGPLINSTSSEVLLDPMNVQDIDDFRRYVSFEDGFLQINSHLGGPVLTDTHFKERNRMARFVAFLAQSQADALANPFTAAKISRNGRMHGVAVDEGTALIIPLDTGIGTVETTVRRFGDLPGYVFFGQTLLGTTIGFPKGSLTTTLPVSIMRVGAGAQFKLRTWEQVRPYLFGSFLVKINDGVATSRGLALQNDLYYPFSSLDPRL